MYVYDTLTQHYLSLTIPLTEGRHRLKVAKLICEDDQFCFKIFQSSQREEVPSTAHFLHRGGKWKASKISLPPVLNKRLPYFPPSLPGKTLFQTYSYKESLCAYNKEEERFYELPVPRGTQAHTVIACVYQLGLSTGGAHQGKVELSFIQLKLGQFDFKFESN